MNTILLAAGLSKRMGTQKLLLPFGETTVINTVLSNLYAANLLPIFAVFSKEVAEAVTERPDWLHVSINPMPERGQSSSLAIGLGMLPDGEDFCIMLGDLPLVNRKDLVEITHKFETMNNCKTVLTPCRNGAFGHPMFYRAVWKERFKSASGDIGGKKILLEHGDEIIRVETSDRHFRDIDTPDDYKILVKDN